jgi:peroxiredoxin
MFSASQLDEKMFGLMYTSSGESLAELTKDHPVLLVFLRHFGCTFCREALSDLASQKAEIEELGTELVFVHMASNEVAERYFSRYELAGVKHISDPECTFYSRFGLTKGTFTQLFGLQSWIRGFSAGVMSGHGVGTQLGDGFQMPGIFVINNGKVLNSFIHKLASDRPDYLDMVNCCQVTDDIE